MASSKPVPSSGGKCPICERASDAHYRPFCSRRCADIDLSRWLSGAYAIPVRADDDEDGGAESGGEQTQQDEAVEPPQPARARTNRPRRPS
jgi:uncharacterized protein